MAANALCFKNRLNIASKIEFLLGGASILNGTRSVSCQRTNCSRQRGNPSMQFAASFGANPDH